MADEVVGILEVDATATVDRFVCCAENPKACADHVGMWKVTMSFAAERAGRSVLEIGTNTAFRLFRQWTVASDDWRPDREFTGRGSGADHVEFYTGRSVAPFGPCSVRLNAVRWAHLQVRTASCDQRMVS